MATSLTEETRKKANLRLLQRSIDANIQDIVGSATHVVLYEYIAPQGWEKSQVEGSIFLTVASSQQQHPGYHYPQTYSLVILNRHSTENFKVAITASFQLQHKEPYLIFKQSSKILGIWFHNASERVVMASLLNQVIQNLQQQQQQQQGAIPPPNNAPTKPPPVPQPHQQPPPPQQAVNYAAAVAAGSPQMAMHHRVAVSPMAQQMPQATSNTPTTRTQASMESPSALIEPLMNSLFVSPASTTEAARQASTPTTADSGSSTPTRTIPGVALDKKSLQLALLSLIQDDRFIDLLHAQYLKVAHARARNTKK